MATTGALRGMFLPSELEKQIDFSTLNTSAHELSPDQYNRRRRSRLSVGIHMGMDFCSVCAMENAILQDVMLRVPCVVSFTGNDSVLCGEHATNIWMDNIDTTIYRFMGFVGRRFSDKWAQNLIERVEYGVECDAHDEIIFRINVNGEECTYSTIDMVTFMLKYLINESARILHIDIENVAISVGSSYGQAQRQAILAAARQANIRNVRLVSAAIGTAVYSRYFLRTKYGEESLCKQNLVVAEMLSDAAAISIVQTNRAKRSRVDVVRSFGVAFKYELGIQSLISKLALELEKLFEEQTRVRIPISGGGREARLQLNFLAASIISDVTFWEEDCLIPIALNNLVSSTDFTTEVHSRWLKDLLLEPFCFNVNHLIDQAFEDVRKPKPKRITQCIVVCDDIKIPHLDNTFGKYFHINTSFRGKPTIARGCALVQAVDLEVLDEPLSLEVLPMSISMAKPPFSHLLERVFDKNLSCPCKRTMTMPSWIDELTEMIVAFYEGESMVPSKCTMIGNFSIQNIEPRPCGSTCVALTVHIDKNGVYSVSAEDISTQEPILLTVVQLYD